MQVKTAHRYNPIPSLQILLFPFLCCPARPSPRVHLRTVSYALTSSMTQFPCNPFPPSPLTLLFLAAQCTEASGQRSSCWLWLAAWWEACCWCVVFPSSAPGPTKSAVGSCWPRVSSQAAGIGYTGQECSGRGPQCARGWGGTQGWGGAGEGWGLWWKQPWLGINDPHLPHVEINVCS